MRMSFEGYVAIGRECLTGMALANTSGACLSDCLDERWRLEPMGHMPHHANGFLEDRVKSFIFPGSPCLERSDQATEPANRQSSWPCFLARYGRSCWHAAEPEQPNSGFHPDIGRISAGPGHAQPCQHGHIRLSNGGSCATRNTRAQSAVDIAPLRQLMPRSGTGPRA